MRVPGDFSLLLETVATTRIIQAEFAEACSYIIRRLAARPGISIRAKACPVIPRRNNPYRSV